MVRINDDKLKKHFEKYAKLERRSFNQFLINSAVIYIKDHYEDDYDQGKKTEK